MRPGFKSRKCHLFIYFFCVFFFVFFEFFNLFIFCVFFFLSLLLQCKFANSTLLSLLSFSYFISPYDAQASSAFSALIFLYGQAGFSAGHVKKKISCPVGKWNFFRFVSLFCHCNLPFHLTKMSLLKYLAKIY